MTTNITTAVGGRIRGWAHRFATALSSFGSSLLRSLAAPRFNRLRGDPYGISESLERRKQARLSGRCVVNSYVRRAT